MRKMAIGSVAATSLIALMALSGCSSSATTDAATGGGTSTTSNSFSISGTLAATSLMREGRFGTRRDDIAAIARQVSSRTTDYTSLLVSCVTFSVPPIAGTGGTVSAAGSFTVAFEGNAKGKNFGCFITSTTEDFVIPMVFQDSSKTGLDGEASQSTRIAVSSNITIPAISLDLDTKEAVVDVATIQNTDDTSQTGDDVLSASTGTKLDFTGEYVISAPSAEGITVPAGYSEPLTIAQMVAMMSGNGGGGPIAGMHIYLHRLSGTSWTTTNPTACDAAMQSEWGATGANVGETDGLTDTELATLVSGGACVGTADSDPIYGVMLWGPPMDSLSTTIQSCVTGGGTPTSCLTAYLANTTAQSSVTACGNKMGITEAEAKVHGGVALTAGTLSFGRFQFPNLLDMTKATGTTKDDVFGLGSERKPLKCTDSEPDGHCDTPATDYRSTISEGWKFAKAQLMSTEGECESSLVTLNGMDIPAWRCKGKYDASHNGVIDSGEAEELWGYNLSMGCVISAGTVPSGAAVGDPVQFTNSHANGGDDYPNSFFGTGWSMSESATPGTTAGPNYLPLTTFNGVALAGTGWSGNAYTKTFIPRVNGTPVFGTSESPQSATVTCTNLWKTTHVAGNTVHTDGYFIGNSMGSAGTLCSTILSNANSANSDTQRLVAMKCYARAWWAVRSQLSSYGYYDADTDGVGDSGELTSCVPNIQLNEGATDPWNYKIQNGPERANSEFVFELFNYTSDNAGTFSMRNDESRGVEVKTATGGSTWINCRMNRNETITLQAFEGNNNKLLVEYTSITNLVDDGNEACVANQDDIGVGTEKMMFVMTK